MAPLLRVRLTLPQDLLRSAADREMTMPEPVAARKSTNALWLWAPYVLAALIFAGWSAYWFEVRNQVALAMDGASAQARREGVDLAWKDRAIGGYPFRIDVTLSEPEAGEPSGWRLAAPRIKAVANVFDLNHWVIAAGQGVVLTRPRAGATLIVGDLLRASWVGQGSAAPRIVVEGLKLTFTPQPGAGAFPLASADRAVFYTRPQPDDGMEARLFLAGARANPLSHLGEVTGPVPTALMWQGEVSHLSAFRGRDAPAGARAWSAAGGVLTTTLCGVAAGGRALGVHSSRLSTDTEGRLIGEAQLELKGGGDALRALGAAHAINPSAAAVAAGLLDGGGSSGGRVRVALTFQAGAVRLGSFPISRSPKLF
jgi:hypothetical protein